MNNNVNMKTPLLINLQYFLVIFTLSATVVAKDIAAQEINTIRMLGPRSDYDLGHNYHKGLLTKALAASANGRTIPPFFEIRDMTPSRAALELEKGAIIDVHWLGTSIELEESLRAIRIPTTRGLIGWRKFIILKKNRDRFEKIKNLKQLSKNYACQGQQWPDTPILEAAGLRVVTSIKYEDLFKMLQVERCAYFPRGFHDHDKELNVRRDLYPEMISYKELMLQYPFAVYFFTSKNNKILGDWIESGMKKLAENGDILRYMQQHELTSHVFPLNKRPPKTILSINNPLLSQGTPIEDPALWFQLEEFKNSSHSESTQF